MSHTMPTLRLAAVAAALTWAACATDGRTAGEPSYASDAETNFKLGLEALESKNYAEAERYFEFVRSRFPFAEASKEAELKLADTDFERERWLEARDRYQSFVKLHPTHPKVDYAAFRAALTHYRDIPSDLFIFPPSSEKDQAQVRGTLTAMTDFVRQHPNSQYKAEAQERVEDAKKRLAKHELYVASFYRKRERWKAVVGRLERVVNEYPGVGFDEEAYFGLYDAYLALDDKAKAEQTLQRVVEKMPNTPAAERAKKKLGQGG